MTLGLIGKKCGMTRIFTEDGVSIPVTVVEVQPNRVVQIKDLETDGYCAIQVTLGEQKVSRLNKPLLGHYTKAKVEAGEGLWEFTLSKEEVGNFTVGQELKVSSFVEGAYVDATGITKGKGFAGVMKRHHFAGGYASHGCSVSHRVPGSIGQRQTPGKVFKGKKMAGHLGNVRRTIQNQQIVKVDVQRNLLLIKGGIPGSDSGFVIIRSAIKKEVIHGN